MEVPKYQQPPLDPAFAAFMQQTKEQDADAAQAGYARETNSLTARYGELTTGDTAMLLARYGARLALANSSGGVGATPGAAGSPLLRAAA